MARVEFMCANLSGAVVWETEWDRQTLLEEIEDHKGQWWDPADTGAFIVADDWIATHDGRLVR